ncbi:hypothetical protein COU37_02000 [Candidatus Micrarchaeota archaeon CG10_big_fil_rev_8_21_14_0_10_45_29]|nr:MAG: hypothetical protein COU37_02000 [Candidatus Micrarchaeota archaeon CG10_big_fil_rev_8_21_14_0_10_45_29]
MDKRKSLLKYTWDIYRKNFALLVLAAVPGLLGLVIPLIVSALNTADPIYISLGATYLRTMSIVDLSTIDVVVMGVSFLISLYLMSFAIVGINLVVKRQRTLRRLEMEVIKSIAQMTNSVFVVFLSATMILLIIQVVAYEYNAQAVLAPILNFVVGLGLLLMPAALVMDDVRAFRALQRGLRVVAKSPRAVFEWIVVALILLSVLDFILFFVFGLLDNVLPFNVHFVASWIVLAFNSLIILPYLIVMLAQIYISKYTILVD